MEIKTPEIPRDIERAIEGMPSISPIIGKINEISREMDTAPKDLIKIIMLDPVLTGRVINLVNSSFYGLTERVKSLAQAVVLLGVNTVKNLAISTALFTTVFIKEKRSPIDPEEFWRHCLATAVGCRYLAKTMQSPPETLETFFIAGLLHDVGKILFIRTDPIKYLQAIDESRRLGVSLEFAELAHFGCTHTQAGGLLARKWKLDSFLVEVVELHHSLPGVKPMIMRELVAVSNNLCKEVLVGESGNSVVEEMSKDLREKHHIQQRTVSMLIDLLPNELEKAAGFLHLSQEKGNHEN